MRLAALALLAALIAAAPGWGRAPRFHVVGTATAPPVTDGHRFAAYQDGARTTVLDTRRHTSRVLRPTRCHKPVLRAVGAGRVLWGCRVLTNWGEYEHAIVGDIATGRIRHAADSSSYVRLFESRLSGATDLYGVLAGIGSVWTSTLLGNGHRDLNAYVFVNWRTGETVADFDRRPGSAIPDLDNPGLWKNMCAPLIRRAPDTDDPHTDFEYERPFGVEQDLNARRLNIYRCGRRQPRSIRCYLCTGVQLGAGRVTWLSGRGRVRLYDARRNRLWRPRLPGLASGAAHTTSRIFTAIFFRMGGLYRYRVYEAKMPN